MQCACGLHQANAGFLAALAQRLEMAREQGNTLAQHNLLLVAVHAYLCGLMGPSLMYSLLQHLTARSAPNRPATSSLHNSVPTASSALLCRRRLAAPKQPVSGAAAAVYSITSSSRPS